MTKPTTNTVLAFGFAIGMAICIWALGTGDTTARESLLISVVLTFLSVLASWIVSSFYAEYSATKNLRTFALKAAEKVTNLSNELDRLSRYLQQELETTGYPTEAHALIAKNLRIEGAIHMVATLKSVNDTSLSDWKGVIGDEINAQREEEVERQEEFRDLLSRVELLLADSGDDESGPEGSHLEDSVESLKSDVRVLAAQISGGTFRRIKALNPLEQIERPCPKCSEPVTYRQRPKQNGMKGITCKKCRSSLVSRSADGQFVLSLRVPVREGLLCPACRNAVAVDLDPMPGSSLEVDCPLCRVPFRVFRTPEMVGVKQIEQIQTRKAVLDEQLLERVRGAMPPQPWPKGAAQNLAEQLGVSRSTVSLAVRELIRRGVFMPQMNGRLYSELSSEQGRSDET